MVFKKYILIVLLGVIGCKLLPAQKKKNNNNITGGYLNIQYNFNATYPSLGGGLYIIRRGPGTLHFIDVGINYGFKRVLNPNITFEQSLFLIDYNLFTVSVRNDLLLGKNTHVGISPGVAVSAIGVCKLYYSYNFYYYNKINNPQTELRSKHTIGFLFRIKALSKY